MPKVPILSAKDVIKILTKAGFHYSRQKGSHMVMVKFVNDKKIIVVVPNHKEIDPGTLLSIIDQSNMPKEEFSGIPNLLNNPIKGINAMRSAVSLQVVQIPPL